MKQQHSLDHDGLDGILQSSHKPKSKYVYFRLFWLLPFLVMIAGAAAFWLQGNRQTQKLNASAKQENLLHSSEDKISIAKNESTAAPASTQSMQPPSSAQSGNVSPPGINPEAEALPDTIHSNKSHTALEKEIPQVIESSGADTPTSEKPTVFEPVPASNSQNDTNLLIDSNIKVKFKFASSEVVLTKTKKTDLTRFLEKCNNQILITGYTCNRGSPEHNQKLGLARALALKRLLISKGVPDENIITVSEGMQNPIASNETPSGRALNRRAELTCKGKS